MLIAVDSGFIHSERSSYKKFIFDVFEHLANRYPQHHFIFFSYEKNAGPVKSAANATTVNVSIGKNNFFVQRWLYDVKIPLVLKKYKADLFIAVNGKMSLTASVAQVLLFQKSAPCRHHRIFNRLSDFISKKITAAHLTKAKAIIVLSASLKDEIKTSFAIPEQNISIVHPAVSTQFNPPDETQKAQIKDKHANACEYFIYRSDFFSLSILLEVLRAFSIFKKWQKTNLKLVVCGVPTAVEHSIEQKLKTYKYRNEISIVSDLSLAEWPLLLGGAYAAIVTDDCGDFAFRLIEAMQYAVPAISFAGEEVLQIAGDAALFAQVSDTAKLAEQMKLIFKDEQLRKTIIERGNRQAEKFNISKSATQLWSVIERVF